MMTGEIATQEMAAIPKILQRMANSDEADRHRTVAERGRIRAAVLDPVPELGQDLPPVRPRSPHRDLARRRRALVQQHHAALHRPVRLLHAGAVPREERRSAAREQAEASRAHRLRPRDPEGRLPAPRLQGRRPAAPDVHVPALLSLLEEPDVDDAGRPVRVVRAPAADRCERRRAAPAAGLHGRPLLFQRVVSRHRGEPRVRDAPAFTR